MGKGSSRFYNFIHSPSVLLQMANLESVDLYNDALTTQGLSLDPHVAQAGEVP